MKHKLLSLFALAGAMFMSTSAMAWDYPTMPAPLAAPATFNGTWVEPEADGQYYIYNVGAGLFLGGGQTWGTRGIVLSEGVVLTTDEPAQINNVSNNTTANYVLPFELVLGANEGEWYINVLNNSKANSGAGHFVGEDGAQTWIDGDESRNTSFGAWYITKAFDNGYMIQNYFASESKYTEVPVAFGVDGNNITATWATTWTDLVQTSTEETVTRPWLEWRFVSAADGEAVKAYCAEFQEKAATEEYQAKFAAYQDAVAAFKAKFALKAKLEEADEAGVSTEAAGAVYNNANATAEEVEAATSKLNADILRAGYDFYGTEDDPQDITDMVLVNSDFSQGNIDGWKTNYVSGNQANNIGYQYSAGTTNITFTDREGNTVTDLGYKNGDSYISKFIEAWKSDADPWVIGDGYLQQTAYALPKGKYVLHCDAIATYQWGNAAGSNPVQGVYLFIQSGDYEVKQAIATGNGLPEHFSVTFISDGSDELTFGLKTESATANWIAADNFQIIFYGETEDSPELATLKEAIKQGNAVLEKYSADNNIESTDDINVSRIDMQALENAISAGESAASGSDADAQTAAAKAIQDAAAAVEASKKIYAQYKTIYDEGYQTIDKLGQQWTDLQEQIEDFLVDDLQAKFEEGTLTADQLEEYQNKVSELVRAYISDPSKIQVGDDLTFLLVNPDFTTGTTANPTGWTINNGAMTELRTRTHNIETYHAAFDLSQTIPNMPAGVYDVTLQGFARHDGADTDKTWLYGGISKESLISLNDDEEQMREEPIYCEANLETYPNLGDGYYDNTASNGMYKANGMTGAYHWFRTENPNTGENYYTNHVKVVMTEPGDLTIGIHCETTTDWVIFDNFQISFRGEDNSVFAEMVEKKQTELQTLVDMDETSGLGIAQDIMKTVTDALDFDADDITSSDEAIAEIADIESIIAKVKESIALYNSIAEKVEFFTSLCEEVEVAESFYSTLSAVDEDYQKGYATFADMQADDKVLQENWAAAVASNLQEGDDATAAILNPTYDGFLIDDGVYSDVFWTSDSYHAADYYCCEFFNYQGNNEHFKHYQTLKGMKPGYYTVSVEGYYRYGDNNPNTDAGTPGAGNARANGEEVLNPVLFVESAAGNNSVALKSIFEGAQADALGVGDEVQAEGFEGYIPNNMQAAQAYLEMELYTNKLDVQVGEDGVLTIGILKNEAVLNDWTIFTGWKLKYLGTTPPDAIENVNANAAANTVIYGIDGRQQSQLRRGINIVRQNGKVEKVLVK